MWLEQDRAGKLVADEVIVIAVEGESGLQFLQSPFGTLRNLEGSPLKSDKICFKFEDNHFGCLLGNRLQEGTARSKEANPEEKHNCGFTRSRWQRWGQVVRV